MRDSVTGSVLDDPLAVTMLEDPFHASLDYPPYPGLRPFVSAEWPIFFGRETMTDEIIGLVTKKHLVVIHGDSGSGKSSIVRAGVLVQLQQGHAATDATWRTCAMLPREDPLGNLARALAGLRADEPTPDQTLDVRHILNRGRRAPETLSRLLRQGESDHICILVDQFEELFSFAKRSGLEDARLFVDLLVGLEEHPPPGLYAILTMRSEFLGHCARFEGLAEAVNKTQYLLPRMERPALLRAIREPATLYGGEVSQELAERLVADAGGGQDQLPLIQHGLMRLCRGKLPAEFETPRKDIGRHRQSPTELVEAASAQNYEGPSESAARFEIDEAPLAFRRDDGPIWRLDLKDYRDVEDLAKLLSEHADEVMTQAARDLKRQKIVEHLFRALTDINAEGQAIRRPQIFAELVAVTGSDDATLAAIIDHFRAEGVFFLTPYGDTPIEPGTLIDISHEALIRQWQKIARPGTGWLEAERRDALEWKSLLVQAEGKGGLTAAAIKHHCKWLKCRNEKWTERYGGGWDRIQDLIDRNKNSLRIRRRVITSFTIVALSLAAAASLQIWRQSELRAIIEARIAELRQTVDYQKTQISELERNLQDTLRLLEQAKTANPTTPSETTYRDRIDALSSLVQWLSRMPIIAAGLGVLSILVLYFGWLALNRTFGSNAGSGSAGQGTPADLGDGRGDLTDRWPERGITRRYNMDANLLVPNSSKVAERLLGAYLVVLILLFTYLLIEFWPTVTAEAGGEQGWADTVTLWFGPSFQVDDDIRLLLIVILAAAVGSYIHAATSFATYVGNQTFVASWTWWYLLRPFIGMALALVFYFVIRGGLLSVQSDAADFNPYGTAAVAGLVGIFSKQATDKLEEVFTNLFRTEPGKGDDERRNKVRDAVPVTNQMVPLRKMRKVVLATDRAERDVQAERNIKLSDLFKVTNEGFTRVPILDQKNLCRYVVHQSLIYKFMARRVIEGEPPEKLDPRTVTLEDFLAFDDVMNYVHHALAFVPPTARLGDAQAAMEQDEDCQDILVTKTGTREGEVLGWLTNIDIARHIKA